MSWIVLSEPFYPEGKIIKYVLCECPICNEHKLVPWITKYSKLASNSHKGCEPFKKNEHNYKKDVQELKAYKKLGIKP